MFVQFKSQMVANRAPAMAIVLAASFTEFLRTFTLKGEPQVLPWIKSLAILYS